MATSRTLTLATLRQKGACKEQLALFRKLFGKSVEVTEALAGEHATAFSWGWAADRLLSAQALAAYDAARAQALAAYEAAIAQALAAYDAARAQALAAYDAARAQALAAYDAARAQAWAAYSAARAQACARAYISDGEQ